MLHFPLLCNLYMAMLQIYQQLKPPKASVTLYDSQSRQMAAPFTLHDFLSCFGNLEVIVVCTQTKDLVFFIVAGCY